MSLTQDMLQRQHAQQRDEFVGFWARILLWVGAQGKLVSMGLVALFVLLGVWFAGSNYWHGQQVKASEQFYTISLEADDAKRLQLLQDFVAQYERQPSAKFALFEIAKLQQKNNNAAESLATLQKLVPLSQPQPMLNIAARFALGNAYQNTGKSDEALKVFEGLSQEKTNPLRLEAQFQAGLCYEQLKQFDKAKAQYQNILNDNTASESMLKKKAEDRLLELRLQG